MSALGQKQTCAAQNVMSALPPIADIGSLFQSTFSAKACWKMGPIWNGKRPGALTLIVSYLKEIPMDKHDQELLDKQLWGVSRSPPNSGIIIIGLITVFLVGIGIGDILSKTKQANAGTNTNYVAIFPNGKE